MIVKIRSGKANFFSARGRWGKEDLKELTTGKGNDACAW